MQKYHYFTDPFNKIIAYAVFINILLCILSNFIEMSMTTSILFSFLSLLGLSIKDIKECFSNRNNKSNQNENIQEDDKEVKINRNERVNELKSKHGIIILTGESGIGKTCLLGELRKILNSENKKCLYMDNYYQGLEESDLFASDYIILDQFEKAFQISEIKYIIQLLEKYNDKYIIVSIRKEFLGDLFHNFRFDKSDFFWLDISEKEQKEIEGKLKSIANTTKNRFIKNPLYSKIIDDVKTGNISFIQFSYICKEIQYNDMNDVLKIWNDSKHNYNNFIEYFIEKKINDFEYSEFAYQIIYLLCLDTKGNTINNLIDFQNISIQSKDIIKIVIDFLCDEEWIKKVNRYKNSSKDSEEYEISHDYFYELLTRLCQKKLDEAIKSNIEHYHFSYRIDRMSDENYEEMIDKKNKIKIECEKFLNNRGKLYVNICLCVVLMNMFINNIVALDYNIFIDHNCFTLIIFNIILGLSIYYLYNYYYHFLSFFDLKYYIIVLFGATSCLAPFYNIKFWAVPFGISIFASGIVMLCISTKIESKEKNYFQKRVIIFTSFGITIILLSLFFDKYTGGELLRALPLYILYIIYMGVCIWGHINSSHLQGLVGKVLYGQRY